MIEYTGQHAEVTGIDNHTVPDVPLATVAGKIQTTNGPAIAIFHQYAYHGKGSTVHSPHQMTHFGVDIDDKSVKIGHKQRIITPEGYVIPLVISGGLPYMPMEKPTEEEMEKYPTIFFTSDQPWDPTIVDYT